MSIPEKEWKQKLKRDINQNRLTPPDPSATKTLAKEMPLVPATKNVGASASTTQAHDQLSEKISHARIAAKVFPNLLTPRGEDLGVAAKFVKAWNDADCPTGPSRVLQSLHNMEHSFDEMKRCLEVTHILPIFSYS